MRFEEDAARLQRSTLALLAPDAERGARLRLRVGPLHADFSRQLIDSEALDRLLRLADRAELQRMRSEFAAGEALNSTRDARRCIIRCAQMSGSGMPLSWHMRSRRQRVRPAWCRTGWRDYAPTASTTAAACAMS